MTFAKKIFIAVFVSTLTLGTILIWSGYEYSVNRSEHEFISRYQVFTRILADTLSRLDTNTEALMMNAAKVVSEKDERHGLLSTDALRALQGQLGITHLFIVDNKGRFLRSTNDDPATIPNLFSFCDNYRKLIAGGLDVEATPIIKPNPEPKPFKFLSIPNHNRTRIVEVGIRVDFIAKTLAEAIKSDKNVESMSLFAPDGTPFGTFSEKNVVFEEQKAALPTSFGNPISSGDYIHFYTKVESSHPRCCQCDVSETSKNGEYYYVLESKVSKAELKALQAKANLMFLLVGLGNGIFSWALARFLARRLMRNIRVAVEKVRTINETGTLSDRIGLHSKDEISYLTTEFDRLLDSLQESQAKLIEAEKVQSKVELAKVVAHNIKSPVLAIEMMLPGLVTVPERMRRVLKNSVKEIKELSEKLKTQSDSMIVDNHNELDTDLVFLPIFLDDLIRQKQLEYSEVVQARFELIMPSKESCAYVRVSSLDLKSVLSNLMNNAVESYGKSGGKVRVELAVTPESCAISVIDLGAGIPSEFLSQLGHKAITFKGSEGRGVGMVHAFKTVESWGGKVEIESKVGTGTKVRIILPRYLTEKTESPSNVVPIARLNL